ncbi:hypothetical protein K1719_032403 [Acacia pycnantha]|nr:hypothetical protein K1719_032403 [Acacia pycnantha]
MNDGEAMEEDSRGNDTAQKVQDTKMTDDRSKEANNKTQQKTPEGKSLTKSQISYKAKLLGRDEKDFNKDLEELMSEWIKEEEEQRKLLDTLRKLNISDARLKEFCRA